VAGRKPRVKTMMIKYDTTINKGKNKWITSEIPQKKIDKKSSIPAIKKNKTAKPLNPV
jgi:hypothetical protein